MIFVYFLFSPSHSCFQPGSLLAFFYSAVYPCLRLEIFHPRIIRSVSRLGVQLNRPVYSCSVVFEVGFLYWYVVFPGLVVIARNAFY